MDEHGLTWMKMDDHGIYSKHGQFTGKNASGISHGSTSAPRLEAGMTRQALQCVGALKQLTGGEHGRTWADVWWGGRRVISKYGNMMNYGCCFCSGFMDVL